MQQNKQDAAKAAEVAARFQRQAKIGRERLGYSIREMAEQVGVSSSHVMFIESGRRFPSLPIILGYSRVLRTRPARLLFGK